MAKKWELITIPKVPFNTLNDHNGPGYKFNIMSSDN